MKAIPLAIFLAFAGASAAHALPPGTEIPYQPSDEAAAQKMLPKVHDPLWSKLIQSKVSVDQKKGTFGISVTPEIKALDGKHVSLRGFVLPLDGSDRTSHFLITRNTPVCLYCPPGEPNEVVEVVTERPVEWTSKVMHVAGTFRLINDREQALFFKIEKAVVSH